MNAFEILLKDFAEKTGVTPEGSGPDSVDIVADDVFVSVQYRQDRNDCVIFTLPISDSEPDAAMLPRALELAAHGEGTGGHYLGLVNGMLVLSSVVPLTGLSTEDFAKRLLELAAASRGVAEVLTRVTATETNPQYGEPNLMQV